MRIPWLALGVFFLGCGGAGRRRRCCAGGSSTIALTSRRRALWVVNPDADSVSVIDPATRARRRRDRARSPPPTVDATTRATSRAVKPRALAILPDDSKVYVAGADGERRLIVVDAKSARRASASIPVGAAPVGVVAAPDGGAVYVVSHEAAQVTKIDPRNDSVIATLDVGEHPWGASALGADGESLFVSHLLLPPA